MWENKLNGRYITNNKGNTFELVVVAYPTNLKVIMLTIDEGDGMGLEKKSM